VSKVREHPRIFHANPDKVCWWAYDHVLQVHKPRVQPPLERIVWLHIDRDWNCKIKAKNGTILKYWAQDQNNDWTKHFAWSLRPSGPTSARPQAASQREVGKPLWQHHQQHCQQHWQWHYPQYLQEHHHMIIIRYCPQSPVLKIWFGPPNADFWSVWSSQKARKFRQIQPTTKVRILCFDCPLRIKINDSCFSLCFQWNI